MHRKELVYISNIIWVEESALEPSNSFHCSSNQKMQIQQAIGFLRLIDPVNLTLLQQQKAGCLEGPKSQMVTTCWPSKLKISAEDMAHGWAIVYYLLKQLSVQFRCSVVSNSFRSHGLQHARPPCPSPTPGVYPNSCPLSCWCHPTISSSVIPSPPALNLSQHQGLFKWVSASHQVAKILEFQPQHQSFQWTLRANLL